MGGEKRRRGFTLVELLVVIAVIVMLIAILLPVLAKARAAARRTVCLTRVRGLSLVLVNYIHDFNNLPVYPPYTTLPNQYNYWSYPLAAYGNSSKARQCPEALDSNPLMWNPGTTTMVWNQPNIATNTLQLENGAYAFNGYLYGNLIAVAPPPPPPVYDLIGPPPGYDDKDDSNLNDADDQTRVLSPNQPAAPQATPFVPNSDLFHFPIIQNLSVIPTFADATWSEVWPLETDTRPASLIKGNGNGAGNQMGDVCIARHSYTANVAFLDGHAENVKLPQLWTLEWHANWVTPARLPIIP